MDSDHHGLKHSAFFALTGKYEEGTREAAIATSGLLTMRLIDHWLLAGPVIVAPESVSVRSNRAAAMALPKTSPFRPLMLGLINEMQQRLEVDIAPILPRLAEYALLLDKEEWSAPLAADVRYTIERLQAEFNAEAELIALFEEAARLVEEEERKSSVERPKAKVRRRRRKPR